MNILVVRSGNSPRAESFIQHALENRHDVHRSTPGKRMPHIEEPWLGVVCFAPGVSSSDLQMLREDVRYLSAGLFVVSTETRPFDQHNEVHWPSPEIPDARLLQELTAHCRAEPAAAGVRDQVAPLLITAVRQTLVEMAGAEVFVRSVYQRVQPAILGNLSAVLATSAASEGLLILSFSAATAESLGRRILAEVKAKANPEIIQDCMGEIGNVVAGQAKTLLAGTPYHFTFSPPKIAAPNANRIDKDMTSLVIAFDSDVGNLGLQWCQQR